MTEEKTLEWCNELVNRLEDGGIWKIPRSNSVLKINKKLKRFIFILGEDSEFEATKEWFGKIGYSVIKE